MMILHVTPIVKGNGPDRLSYFSAEMYPIGSIVMVPLRKREVPALVVEHEDARAIKSILRTNMYETRKIRAQKPHHCFTPEFIAAARASADYFATSTGSVIRAFIPAAVLERARSGDHTPPNAITASAPAGTFEKLILQLPWRERVEKYKPIIRGVFARKRSVYIVVPSAREAHALRRYYERGIEKYTFVLDSSKTKKQLLETWDAILNEPHPVLIIATPLCTSIPRADIGMFIIEREMASVYKQMTRPFIDARVFIEHLAQALKASLVVADTVVGLRGQRELYTGHAHELEEHASRFRTRTKTTLIDIAAVRTAAQEAKEDFPVLSPDALACIERAVRDGGTAFVFAARRGISAQTVCRDCGTTVACAHCSAPVVLHTKGTERVFLCHRCGQSRDAHERCVSCDSWNLMPLGVGIERVTERIRQAFPDAPLFVLSSDSVKNQREAQQVADDYAASSGAILVGTEMALGYLTTDATCTVISSIDSLLCIPDFRIEEKLFGLIVTLKERTTDTLLIETTNTRNAMLKYATQGNIAEYARGELEVREQLRYPPYTHLIKVTCEGSRAAIIRDMQRFVEAVARYKPRVFSAFVDRGRGQALHALIRIPEHAWPDEQLVAILRALPPSFSVDVNPERTL